MHSSSRSTDAVDSLARQQWSDAQRGAAELLSHLPDVGDHRTQRAVEALVEQASDALLAVADVLADLGAPTEPAMLPATTEALAVTPRATVNPDVVRRTPRHGLGVLGRAHREPLGDAGPVDAS